MKCPKCGYLGFETGDRCRNCGHDFSLPPFAAAGSEADLMIRDAGQEEGPPLDLTFGRESDTPDQRAPSRRTDRVLDLDRLVGVSDPTPTPSSSTPAASPEEFPLFPVGAGIGDEMRAKPRVLPRPPLAVRRATPEVPSVRPRQSPRPRQFAADETPPLAGLGLPPVETTEHSQGVKGASPVRRFVAAVIDLAVLGAIDALVVYFTLRLAGLDVGDTTRLPWVPLASFFLLLNGGYLITFAAVGGQTIGQMAFGLRVVGEDGSPVTFGTATVRTLAWLISALPLGLGLWFALGANHTTLHDRLTATRVVLC